MAQLCGANERQVARHVVWPCAVPNIFAGLRISLPIGIAVAVVTELISSNRGLGYLVQMGAMNFDITEVFAAILGATILVLARRLCRRRDRGRSPPLAAFRRSFAASKHHVIHVDVSSP